MRGRSKGTAPSGPGHVGCVLKMASSQHTDIVCIIFT